MKKNKLEGFTMISNSLITSGKEYSDSEFRLYCVLRYHTFQKGHCYPGREKLAKEMGAGLSKIDRLKKSLEKKGLIRKQRRGQGKTNIYFVSDDIYSKIDDSKLLALENPPASRKEYEFKNNFSNNYLENQKSNSGKGKQIGGKTQPATKTPTDVVTRTMLNRIIKNYSAEKERLAKEGVLLEDLEVAKEGVLYYLDCYRKIFGVYHPRYKLSQIQNCFSTFLWGVCDIRVGNHEPEMIYEVVNRWFSTTSLEKNNLLLNHFAGGKDNAIFDNCLDAVMVVSNLIIEEYPK